MVLKGITMTRSTAIGAGAAKFRLQLRQIRVVSSSIGAAPAPTLASSSPTQNVGAKNSTGASAGNKQSFLRKATTGAGGVPTV
jgi:hypothetical protein